ncbi:uncharacterized protein LOC106638791 [Copidosoma floridanum]|uniref:uncharacterized protein LOC106638791 n=1 Tax=Copidosoma floridanum TaxID=29053 RepID=UPI0006C98D32|nr:uncharacterized protein LOC106638791 [Copidosoma floridanum]
MEILSTSYVYNIQDIPGDTRAEKFKFIGQIVKSICAQDDVDFEISVKKNNVSGVIVPLIKVLVGVKTHNSEFIIEALKSDDTYLINEALRARWFYDGSNKLLTNYKYFSSIVFPFVSMKTRREIVKKLSVCLGGQQTGVAADFFNGFVTDYRMQEAVSFLPNCTSEFIYDAIVKYEIVLTNKLLKKLYRNHSEVVVKYLNFFNPYKTDLISRTMFRLLDASKYENFVPMLIPKHPEIFLIMQEIHHISSNLGNRRAKMLFKEAKHIFIQNPRNIIQLVPLKLIYDSLTLEEFEMMFGNLLEECWDMFLMDEIIGYLEYYPEEKRASLLREKVMEKYGRDLFEEVDKIIPKFLLFLPKEKRFALARKIVNEQHKMPLTDCEISWWCYLPINEAIPALKAKILRNWKSNKHQIFSQMIYVCKLNESTEALLDVLQFVDENYHNERSDLMLSMLDRIKQEFNINEFDENYWRHLFNIIKRTKLKKENARDYWVLIKILKEYVHFCDKHELPANEIIDHIVQLFLEGRVGMSWKLLEDEAEYERRYLDVCMRNNYWLSMAYKINVIDGIYNFNQRHCTADNNVPRLSIKDYPHLLEIVERVLKFTTWEGNWKIPMAEKLKQHEPELFNSWFPEGDTECTCATCPHKEYKDTETLIISEIENTKVPAVVVTKPKVTYITEAIIALKKNYSEIKKDWQRYYECCVQQALVPKKKHYVRQFLKSLKWYHEVPIKFAEQALQENNISLLGHLLDGPILSKVARKFIPSVDEKYRCHNCTSASHVAAAIKNANTPTIELVQDFLAVRYMYYSKSYVNGCMKMWSYVAYRTRSDRLIELSRELSRERLFCKRHAIRLMDSMASRTDLVAFLGYMHKTEKHRAVRQILADKIGKLFVGRPGEDTWGLVRRFIEDVKIGEELDLEDLIGYEPMPVDFASDYVTLVLTKVRSFIEQGMSRHSAAKIVDLLLDNIKSNVQDHLSTAVCRDVIGFYMEDVSMDLTCMYRFVIKFYLNPTSVDFDDRLQHLMGLLVMESKRWYALGVEKRRCAPNVVESLLYTYVSRVQKFTVSEKLTLGLLAEFKLAFGPYEHSYGHVMIFLSLCYVKSHPSFRRFGSTLSKSLDSLLSRYEPEYFMHIVGLIHEFTSGFKSYEYSRIVCNRADFLEGLIEDKNEHSLIVAAKLLSLKFVNEYDKKHCRILRQLSESSNKIVQSFL